MPAGSGRGGGPTGSGGGRAAAERRYRRLVALLCPRDFVAEAGEELVQVFRDGWVAAKARRSRGRWARFWVRTGVDLAVTAASEWAAVLAGTWKGAGRVMTNPMRELRLAARSLRRAPGHAALATLTMGLGLAAVVTVFSTVQEILLRPLAFAHPEQLVRIYERNGQSSRFWPSYPDVVDWRDRSRTLSALVPFSYPEVLPVQLPGGPRRLSVAGAGRGFLRMLGVAPAVGRPIADDENRKGGPPVALVSHAVWTGALASAPLDGLTLRIRGETYSVVGVLPPGFKVVNDVDVWTPLERDPDALGRRSNHGYHVLGRVAPGRTVAQAVAELDQIQAGLVKQYGENTAASLQTLAFQKELVAGVRRPLLLLLLAAGLVYAVACLNLASTVLARGVTRSGDIAVRLALGAGRAELIRHLVAETAVVAIPGAVVGLAGSVLALDQVRRLGTGMVPRIQELHADGGVVVVALITAAVAVVAAGVAPALALSRRDVASRLRRLGATAERGEHRRLWSAFLAGQVALTVLLATGSGLLVKSMRAALGVDLGYDPKGVLVADISLPQSRYRDDASVLAYYQAAEQRVGALPGVAAVGVAYVLPDETQTFITSGARPRGAPDDVHAWAGWRPVDRGFFRVMDIPVNAELPPPPTDSTGEVAGLISRSLADRFWKDGSPVGATFEIGFVPHGDGVRVAGMAGNVREYWQEDGLIGTVYVDYRADPARARAMHLVLRSAPGTSLASLANPVRGALKEVDPEVPATIVPFEDRVRSALANRRLSTDVLTAFALMGLLLAAVAVYGAVSYSVARRTREAGIRIALGARPDTLRRTTALVGLAPVGVGLGVGVASSLLALPVLRSQLFGVQPTDPWVLGIAPLVLLGVAALAAYLPARRITRVNPVTALRSEG